MAVSMKPGKILSPCLHPWGMCNRGHRMLSLPIPSTSLRITPPSPGLLLKALDGTALSKCLSQGSELCLLPVPF